MMDKETKGKQSYSFNRRILTIAGMVFSAILLIWLLGSIFKVLLLVLSAILFACFFRGIANWIRGRTNISMNGSLAMATLGILLLFLLANWLFIPRMVSQANHLADQLPASIDNFRQFLASKWWGRQLINQLPTNPQQFISEHSGWALQTFGLLSSTFGILSDFYIITLIGLFLMFNPAPYVNGLVSLIPASGQNRTREVIREVYTILQRWLAGKLMSMFIVAVLTAIGLYALGMPLVLFLSFLAGALAFIPNFGPIIALIPALLVAILQGPVMVLYVLGLYIAVQVVESNFITPFIQREMVYLPLALIIVAQVVLGILVGGLGLVLATPIVATVVVLVRMLYIEDVLGQEVVHG